MDYKPFKDEELDSFQGTLSLPPLNLTDSITSLTNYVVENLDLDKIQRGWLYKILKIPFKPQGKAIVTSTSRYSKIWEEMCEHFDNSMSAQINSKISTFLTSTRLHFIGWRGSQASFMRTGPNSPASITNGSKGRIYGSKSRS
jgi:hypothetical protein